MGAAECKSPPVLFPQCGRSDVLIPAQLDASEYAAPPGGVFLLAQEDTTAWRRRRRDHRRRYAVLINVAGAPLDGDHLSGLVAYLSPEGGAGGGRALVFETWYRASQAQGDYEAAWPLGTLPAWGDVSLHKHPRLVHLMLRACIERAFRDYTAAEPRVATVNPNTDDEETFRFAVAVLVALGTRPWNMPLCPPGSPSAAAARVA